MEFATNTRTVANIAPLAGARIETRLNECRHELEDLQAIDRPTEAQQAKMRALKIEGDDLVRQLRVVTRAESR